jgi:hypothetical protein
MDINSVNCITLYYITVKEQDFRSKKIRLKFDKNQPYHFADPEIYSNLIVFFLLK